MKTIEKLDKLSIIWIYVEEEDRVFLWNESSPPPISTLGDHGGYIEIPLDHPLIRLMNIKVTERWVPAVIGATEVSEVFLDDLTRTSEEVLRTLSDNSTYDKDPVSIVSEIICQGLTGSWIPLKEILAEVYTRIWVIGVTILCLLTSVAVVITRLWLLIFVLAIMILGGYLMILHYSIYRNLRDKIRINKIHKKQQ